MDLGRVVGTVVSTMKAPGLHSYKLMLKMPLDAQLTDNPTTDLDIYVAVDLIGGEGEAGLVCRGSAARVVMDISGVPTDAAIIAVIDTIRARCKYRVFQKLKARHETISSQNLRKQKGEQND